MTICRDLHSNSDTHNTFSNEIKFSINNINIVVPKGITILEAAKFVNVNIPHLCSISKNTHSGKCRLCVVEIKNLDILLPACKTAVCNGMIIETHSKKVREVRKMLLDLILSSHKSECNTCNRHNRCLLQKLCDEIGYKNSYFMITKVSNKTKNVENKNGNNKVIIYNSDKCIRCGRCTYVCNDLQKIGAITYIGRSSDLSIALHDFGVSNTSQCKSCGQCILVCPSGALDYKSELDTIWEALDDKQKTVVALLSPTSKISLGEEFNKSPGTQLCGQIVTALRKLGVKFIFDLSFAADLTSYLYAQELNNRLSNNRNLPLITSSCPTVVTLVEQNFYDLIPNLSIYKSPQQLLAKLSRFWLSEQYGISPKDVFVFSIVPCTAKKIEALRSENKTNVVSDINYVLTNKEFARLLKEAGIDLENLATSSFDPPFSGSSGCGISFGCSGGIVEGTIESLRYLHNLPYNFTDEFIKIRTINEIKYSTLAIGDKQLEVACASGLGNCKEVLNIVIKGVKKLDFIELMGCPGGCVGGSGQGFDASYDVRSMRILALLREDRSRNIRRPPDNPMIHSIIRDLLENIYTTKAKSILEAKYYKRYNI